jgi:hypothetical protein
MKKKELPEQRLVSTRPLKHDLAMQQAAERAKDQPKMITISSKIMERKK